MTRGNQRELARAKNAKKSGDQGKGKRTDDGLSAAARKQRDAEIMQEKQKKANEVKEPPKSK
ncbi:small EDRK-rich factor 2 [Cololabis saira]|uniref:small EDRK-rich factor 2 n=1 Tax=Cololabis saira TaxID=129043 RepID=UPI002AD4B753|nr:small EDRK-rich factor 2 [Cololabis saira]